MAMTVEELYERYVKPLPVKDRQYLVSITTRGLEDQRQVRKGRKWSEIAGTAPYPLVGEDAQQWVNRIREESDLAVAL